MYVAITFTEKSKIFICKVEIWYSSSGHEVGRFKNIPEENRVCEMCVLDEIESESHFLLYCTKYDDLREVLFHEIYGQNPDIFWCSDEQKLEWLFNFNVFKTASFISQAWKRRQVHLFN